LPSAGAPTLALIAAGRFRRSLLGYGRAAVDEAIDGLESDLGLRSEALRASEAKVVSLGSETQAMGRRIVEQEREIVDLRTEVLSSRSRADEELRSLTMLGRQLEELMVGARGQATRIRLRALREAAELNARLVDATEGAPGADRERIIDALEIAIERVGVEWDGEAPTPPRGRHPRPLALEQAPAAPEARNGNGRRRVSVDVGPFEDFSQLVRFEDAANAIGATGDISIKRFSEGRARIDVSISEPIDLLQELEARCDIDFKVRSSDQDEIVLDVDKH
jgi:hypothetical protein